jgi:hypothetical protein
MPEALLLGARPLSMPTEIIIIIIKINKKFNIDKKFKIAACLCYAGCSSVGGQTREHAH